jgi:preprotein translocase subunit SecD
VLKAIELDERDVARAYPIKTPTGESAVGVDFTEAGAKKFEKLTASNINRRLAIVLNGALLSAPTSSSLPRSLARRPAAQRFIRSA